MLRLQFIKLWHIFSDPEYSEADAKSIIMDLMKYPPKILLAFGETIKGNDDINNWLLHNGFPELSALSHAIRGSDEAFSWLMINGFPELAALDSAIDEDQNAYQWLRVNKFLFLIVFADACHGNPEAIGWFVKHNLQVLLVITQHIREFRNSQTYDYHKLHF